MPDVTFQPEDGKRLPCRDGEERTEYLEIASGLRLRVSRSGSRSWAVVYWTALAKTTRRLKLGNAAKMPLSKARAAARAALHAVNEEGRDPQAERVAERVQERLQRSQRAEARRLAAEERKRGHVTFGAVCREYVEARRTTPSGKYNRRARPNTLTNWSSMLKNYILPAIGDRSPKEITREDVIAVLEGAAMRGGASMGPRVRELFCATWRWMEQRPRVLGVELPAVSPIVPSLPKIGDATKERERSLSPAEVWRFWRATAGEGLEGEALRLCLLTGARVQEARALPWSELDLDAQVWNLPAARNKSARDRVIPLSAPAVALLRRVHGKTGGHGVFGEQDRLHEAMIRIRAAMGGAPWQPRDLRRTTATLCARLGTDPFVVSILLGHATADPRVPDVTGTYNRWGYPDQVRAALDRLGAWVDETVTRASEPGDVVRIKAKR